MITNDFFDLGLLKESTMQLYGYASEKIGTKTEKEKYDLIMKLYWSINDLIYLYAYESEFYFHYCVKIALNNSSYNEDSDVVIKLLFPKDSLFSNFNYSFSNITSAKLFLNLYKKYFEIKETISYELYNDGFLNNTFEPANEYYENALFGNSTNKSVSEANRLLYSMNKYEYIEDDKYDIVKVNIIKVRKSTIMLLPTPILLKKNIKKIECLIKSNNIVGELRTEIHL